MESEQALLSTSLDFYSQSLTCDDDLEYGLVQSSNGPSLAVLGDPFAPRLGEYQGSASTHGNHTLLLCPLSSWNARILRSHLPWLNPSRLGVETSAGMGDRLGNATPGHIRAVRSVGAKIRPIFAQQSMREMSRCQRTPQQVMDDATWGIFQEGWQLGYGADADHLKTTADIDRCLASGFTFFTIDPGDQVDNRAEAASLSDLQELAGSLPQELRPENTGLSGRTLQIEEYPITFTEEILYKAAVKYGWAVAFTAEMYRHLVDSAGTEEIELEVSVDETEQPTSLAEHAFIATQLKRLGVNWVSLAPRYPGQFEKGIEYKGDLEIFNRELAGHAAIARHFGPYKISLHTGSDKFSIYPSAYRLTQGLVHLKTAGTSYLEALRAIAVADPSLLQEIYTHALERFPADRASYHVSTNLARAPKPEDVTDWPSLLDQPDTRQILHLTYGSILSSETDSGQKRFVDRLYNDLLEHREVYWENLRRHFERHLEPFQKME